MITETPFMHLLSTEQRLWPVTMQGAQLFYLAQTLTTYLRSRFSQLHPYDFSYWYLHDATEEERKTHGVEQHAAEALIALSGIDITPCQGKYHCEAMALWNALRHLLFIDSAYVQSISL